MMSGTPPCSCTDGGHKWVKLSQLTRCLQENMCCRCFKLHLWCTWLQSTSARLGLEQATKTLIHGENNTSFLQVGPSGYNRFNSRLDFETSLQPAEPFFYGYTKATKKTISFWAFADNLILTPQPVPNNKSCELPHQTCNHISLELLSWRFYRRLNNSATSHQNRLWPGF